MSPKRPKIPARVAAKVLIQKAIQAAGPRPPDEASDPAEEKKLQAKKKNYSQALSEALAIAFAEALRMRGMLSVRPAPPGAYAGGSGAERRIAGGIGAKKVDVSWATEESGLLLGISLKTINFADGTSNNMQKNVTNRRGDVAMEALTLHRRFPYAVLAGFLMFDQHAGKDGTARRQSTFHNSHSIFRGITGRRDHASPDEQFEQFLIALHTPDGENSTAEFFRIGQPEIPVDLDQVLDELAQLVADRNPDLYSIENGIIQAK